MFSASSSDVVEPLLKSSPEDTCNNDEDVDVRTERNRVLSSGSVGSAIVYLHNLRKVRESQYQHCHCIQLTLHARCFVVSGVSRSK